MTLTDLERLHAEATPPKWWHDSRNHNYYLCLPSGDNYLTGDTPKAQVDAELIAALRDLPQPRQTLKDDEHGKS